MWRFSFLLFALAAGFTLPAQESLTTDHYRLWSVSRQAEITLDDLVSDMEKADVLLFGEEHNDSVAHYLQMEVFRLMHQKYGSRVALSMEMFERDVQTVMDEYLSGAIQERHFRKDARVWSNYRDYRPLVEYARDNGLAVICANAASRYTNLAGRMGQEALRSLPAARKAFFAPIPYRRAEGDYLAKLQSFMGGHTPSAPDSSKSSSPPRAVHGGFDLVNAQSLWDATMAWSIAKYRKTGKNKSGKILHLNGRFHSDEHFGVAAQLRHYAPRTRILVLSAGSDPSFPQINWDEFRHLGDYILITDPNVPRTFESGQ
ncbi:MAG: ChaN family lipoprotein [Saprospiraceae bacterium]|nr:ChaN family lipoprotein [Saprospiraceae bacterium]